MIPSKKKYSFLLRKNREVRALNAFRSAKHNIGLIICQKYYYFEYHVVNFSWNSEPSPKKIIAKTYIAVVRLYASYFFFPKAFFLEDEARLPDPTVFQGSWNRILFFIEILYVL
jgi:hypothetical protein